MAFKDLFRECRESMLARTDSTLRALLVEFRDHELIKTKRSKDGIEYYNIPLDNSLLEQFIEEQDNI